MRRDLRECWDELVEHVFAQYRAYNFSVFLNFYHDFEERTLRLRISGPHPDWIVRTVADEELRSGDLRGIAVATFEEMRSA